MLVVDGLYTKYIPTDHSIDGVAKRNTGESTNYAPMLDCSLDQKI